MTVEDTVHPQPLRCAESHSTVHITEEQPVDCEILVVTPRRLAEDDHGAGVRTARLVEVLAAHYRVAVLEPAADGTAATPGVVEHGRHHVIEFVRPSLSLRHASGAAATEGASIWSGVSLVERATVESLRPQIIFWADAIMASAGLGTLAPDALQVVEFANLESRRYAAMTLDGSWKRRAYALLEATKALRWQRTVTRRADAVVTLSTGDAEALPRGRPKLVVRNGIEAAAAHSPSSGASILAVGSWWYGPNRHGLRRFLARDWPRVLVDAPDARLRVVGRGGEEVVPAGTPGVTLEGFVDDLAPLYEESAVVLAPARSGGGSQLKLVGALAHGRVVVGPRFLRREQTTEIPPGAFQADDDMAGSLLRLLRNPSERHRVEDGIVDWRRTSGWASRAAPMLRWIDGALEPRGEGAAAQLERS